ncbi:MAG TPA: alpha/beta fold hydrolase [Sphingomicrobium sp.]|nr:alpha/beta fold hydrolase [Sphingomicrobium sp.]
MTWHRSNESWKGVWNANGPQFFGNDHWDRELDRQLAAYPKTPIVYIHGFNNDNGEALARAAAIRLAVGNDRPVIALTWPSYASKRKYFWDEANAEWTTDEAHALLEHLAGRRSGVIIIAHSMGNRIALDLLRGWASRTHRPLPVQRLVMASPDVDRDWFIRLARRGFPVPVTLYASTRDQPLSASWRSHGHARAGDLSTWVTGNVNGDPYRHLRDVQSLDIVDTSDVAEGLLKHADFIESWQGAADLCRVVRGEHTAKGRAKMTDNMERLLAKPDGTEPCTASGIAAAGYLGK